MTNYSKILKKAKKKKGLQIAWNKGKSIKDYPTMGFQKGHKNYSPKGEESWNWKGGLTPEKMAIRNSIEYRLWREAVYARDNWTCQKCKKKGGELNAHHIKSFAEYSELRTSIENGITLCKKCHKLFHGIYGNKNATQEQLNNFMIKKN